MKNDELWKKSAYVASSTYRYNVLKCILNLKFSTPAKIANNSNIRVNHISKVLGELKDEGLVKCINEEAKKGRVYTSTKLGETVFKQAVMLVEV